MLGEISSTRWLYSTACSSVKALASFSYMVLQQRIIINTAVCVMRHYLKARVCVSTLEDAIPSVLPPS